jgi:hypothetical protein
VDLGRREDYERAIAEFEDVRDRLLPGDSRVAVEPPVLNGVGSINGAGPANSASAPFG